MYTNRVGLGQLDKYEKTSKCTNQMRSFDCLRLRRIGKLLMDIIRLLNLSIYNYTMPELLQHFDRGILIPVNIDVMMQLHNNKAFNMAINENIKDITIVNDSQVICLLYKLLWPSRNLHRVSGSDFLPAFCDYHRDNTEIKIFLLGAGPGVAEKASENINNNLKRKLIVDTFSPSFGFENNAEECDFIVGKINESGASVLAVGVGAPKQEQWIFSHRSRIHNIRIFMAVGASIDFQAGVKKRSPKWMSNVGLEWFYRLITEPRRLCKRYLIDDVPFLWLILRQRLGLYKTEEGMK